MPYGRLLRDSRTQETGVSQGLPRLCGWCGQDLCHAAGGAPPRQRRAGRGHRLRRTSRQGRHAGPCGGARTGGTPQGRHRRKRFHGNGRARHHRPPSTGRAGGRTRPYQCCGVRERQTLSGRAEGARGWHQRHHHPQCAAPRIGGGTRGVGRRGACAGAPPGRHPASGRSGGERRPHEGRPA